MADLNPALLTFQEYLKVANEKGKFHEDNAYDYSLAKLNSYDANKSEYPKLMRRMRIRGIEFEFRLKEDRWGPEVAVWNEDGEKVAVVQDEWGCVLIMVAREYRGFGFGPILGKIARTMAPDKPSGGFTPSGYRNFVKVYREMVRDALKNGFYAEQVRAGKMTVARVKEIVASAKLEVRPQTPAGDLSSGPKDWMLYVGGYGDFVLYDRKLKDVIEKEEQDYWIEKMVKGVMLVREIHNGAGIVVAFGGDSDKIKTLMMTCAISYCKGEGIPLYVDPEDRQYVDPKFGRVSEQSDYKTGYERYPVELLGRIGLEDFKTVERLFRRKFDQYDEFKNRMLEIGFSKWRSDNVAESVEIIKAVIAESMMEDAFHGSPARFDKFSMEFANSGSGSHMFGWGTYFTDRERVAQSFRNLQNRSRERGYVYHVSIPERDEYLRWYDQLSGQSPGVRSKLAQADLLPSGPLRVAPSVEYGHGWGVFVGWKEVAWSSEREGADEAIADIEAEGENPAEYVSGCDIYRHLSAKLGSDKAASLYLLSIGIPGVVTENTGTAGGNYYVLFDPALATIKHVED